MILGKSWQLLIGQAQVQWITPYSTIFKSSLCFLLLQRCNLRRHKPVIQNREKMSTLGRKEIKRSAHTLREHDSQHHTAAGWRMRATGPGRAAGLSLAAGGTAHSSLHRRKCSSGRCGSGLTILRGWPSLWLLRPETASAGLCTGLVLPWTWCLTARIMLPQNNNYGWRETDNSHLP